MPRTISYASMLDREGEDIAILLNPAYQYLSLYLASLIDDNPGAFISDLTIDNTEEIRDYLDEYVNKIIEPQVITPLWQYDRKRIWADNFDVYAGGAQGWSADANQRFGGYFRQNPGVVNDEMRSPIRVPSGKYFFNIRCIKSTSYGIVTVYIDDVSIATIDMYNSTLIYNQLVSNSGTFDIENTGLHWIKTIVASHNVSSTGYLFLWSYMDFIRYSDL